MNHRSSPTFSADAQVVQEHDDHAKVNDDDVAVGFFQDLCRGVQQLQQGTQPQKARRRDDQRSDQPNDDGAGHSALEQVFVLCAVGARRNDGKAVADADAKAD